MREKILRALLGFAGISGLTAAAQAQTAPGPQQTSTLQQATTGGGEAEATTSEVVVTGSRITRNGYSSPTPVTVADTEDLTKATPTNIADGLDKLPQFVGSTGPNRASNVFATPGHGNVLDLRGLGAIRTLVLLDGVRAPATTYQGTVDVDIFPQLLVQRVEVVTSGASAAYGSDAVAGVVNYVLDTRFDGFKGVAQGGISTFGDDGSERFGLAFGRELGDRAHVLLSAEYFNSDGYLDSDRPRLDDQGQAVGMNVGAGVAGTAANPNIFVPGIRYNLATFGGLALSGPFANTNFVSPGSYRPAITGTPTGTTGFFQGGDYYYAPGFQSAAAALKNTTGFARFDYDLTSDVSLFAQVIGAQSAVRYNSLPNLLLTPPIFSGNAYLPAALQTQLTATNTPSFAFTKEMSELGPISTRDVTDNVNVRLGAKGTLSRFKWSLDYTYGDSTERFRQGNQFEETKLAAALDAVVDPSTGQIVCRPTLSADPAVRAQYSGCAPLDPFGLGAASPQAAAYVMGTSIYRAATITNDVSSSISGDVLDAPAGPISAAAGVEYRTQSLNLQSNSAPSTPVDISGLRGLAASSGRFYLTNTGLAAGHESIVEEFAEVAVPVVKELPGVQALDLNGAVREAHYSTSGNATTWKFGGTWEPFTDLRFRATKSRDFRAPTLFDLFAGAQAGIGAALDPHTNVNGTFITRTSGNPDLKPETSDNETVGLVYEPHFLPHFAISVDYYQVSLQGAISTLSPLQTLQDCALSSGTAPSCANIKRPLPYADASAANYPTEVDVVGTNIAAIKTHGIDVDASYRSALGGGELTLRMYASYVGSFQTQRSASQPVIDYAGYNNTGSGGVAPAVPRVKGYLSVNYGYGPLSVFVQEDVIGPIKNGPTLVFNEPATPVHSTTDLTLTYSLDGLFARPNLFLTVNNLFNRTPPLVYGTTAPGIGLSTILPLYDTTGRYFTLGARFQF